MSYGLVGPSFRVLLTGALQIFKIFIYYMVTIWFIPLCPLYGVHFGPHFMVCLFLAIFKFFFKKILLDISGLSWK